ncbi:MAG: hypothetical protein M0D55_10435 [Elusimicrobiota bacterium]|nr:MAG: hypothetical protein M0D55_10435 [Elusimicrobiota bacterium]
MRAAFLATLFVLAACGGPESASKLPDVKLATLGGPQGPPWRRAPPTSA